MDRLSRHVEPALLGIVRDRIRVRKRLQVKRLLTHHPDGQVRGTLIEDLHRGIPIDPDVANDPCHRLSVRRRQANQ